MESDANEYDVVVVGVGGMGSAALYHLARSGADVLGIERYDVPHDMGSSHGNSRIIRRVQNERPSYTPLVERAYELWRRLEDEHGERLLHTTGSVHAAPRNHDSVASAVALCEDRDIPHEALDGDELNERFPGYGLPSEFRAVFQPDGGFLVPEECIVAHVAGAHRRGAEVHARERVLDWRSTEHGVRVDTDEGQYRAERLVVTAGAWTPKFVERLRGETVPERRVMAWFRPREPAHFAPDAFPVFTVDTPDGHAYGFPEFDVPGFKIGCRPDSPTAVDPDEMDREPTDAEERRHREFAERYFPDGAGPTMRLATCMMTQSPDDDFVVDVHPDDERVVVATGFSGNGFKFSSVIGEIVADLALDGESDRALDRIGFGRLQ